MSWVAEELAAVDFGDKRLNKRLVKVAVQWAGKPSQSIPAASGGWGDTAASPFGDSNFGQIERLVARAFDNLEPG